MKVRVTFELDLKDTSYNIPKVKYIPVCLQNLGQWLYELHLHYLQKRGDDLFNHRDAKKSLLDAIIKHGNEQKALSEQLFNNYKVEGVTDDGHKFEFTHEDPGYKEKTIVDGVEVHLEPYDD